MKCEHSIEDLIAGKRCPTPPTKRHGRRFYCAEHAPVGSVDLDRFTLGSAMTVEDKAAEYDRAVEYLRRQGWLVVAEGRVGRRFFQRWQHPDGQGGGHDWMSAFRAECYEDAPAQGKRMVAALEAFDAVVEEKRAAKGAEETVANIECTYCRDLDRRVRAVRGNVLCTDGKRRDVCADHYRAYAWRVS